MNWYLADFGAFAVDPQGGFAGRDSDVVGVEGDDFADAGTCVERNERDGPVTR